MHVRQRNLLAIGIALGAAYGLIAFFALRQAQLLPTISFLFLVPAVMGAVPLMTSDEEQMRWYTRILFIPIATMLSFFMALVLVVHEGILCLLFITAPIFGAALIGYSIAWFIGFRRIRAKRHKAAAAVALLLLPFAFAAFEKSYLIRAEQATARSRITIGAPASQVWEQLAEVSTIGPDEYRAGLFQWLGVPRPIRATVDAAALGGHRVGQFEHGLRFDETITEFEAPSRMSFSIAVDPGTLRAGSAERHAFEARYFRFRDATYQLTELPGGRTELQLSSTYVLESGVNWYGKLWARALVADFQERVLEVLRSRSEGPPLTAGR